MKKYLVVIIGAFLAIALTGCDNKVESQLVSLEVPLTTGVSSELKPAFDPSITEYEMNVPNDISIVEVKIEASDEQAVVAINGSDPKQEKEPRDPTQDNAVMVPLAEGENKVEISVQNKDAEVPSVYSITITREDLSEVRAKFISLSYTSPETGVTLPYRLYIPESYTEGTDKEYPIVFFLHGSGERGSDNELQLSGNIGATVWATEEVQSKQEMFVLAPQARDSGDDGFGKTRIGGEINLSDVYTLTDDAATAKEILDTVINEYSIDTSRVYGTGVSQGGFGIWNLTLEYPELFAAVVPVAGGGDENHKNISNITELPIWSFHAAADPVIPALEDQQIFEVLKANGSNIKYTEYPSDEYFYPVAHLSWIPAYHDEEMIDWMLSQEKE